MENKNINQSENNEVKQNFFVKNKALLLEILRFLIVGGTATLIEWIIAYGFAAFLPVIKLGDWSVSDAIGTTVGFLVSLVFNYFLSLIFVYKDKKNKDSGKSFKDFMIFFLISIIVLGFQVLFIYLVNDLLFVKVFNWTTVVFGNLTWGYIISKVFATVVGLVVNYIGRKIFIFK